MGYELINAVPLAATLVADMDEALQSLPEGYRPSWSLLHELTLDAKSSRIHQAAFSQPLCTVVQVILVEILKLAGVTFAAVVGHSSGEIGAAYAAGFLSFSDAIKVAYLRGYHAHLASGPNSEKGAMMAVASSVGEADEVCSSSGLRQRVTIAACNSSSSLTLSGDADAIAEAKAMFENEKKFARLLKVDTAYHSHHMQPCVEPYLRSMREAGISPKHTRDEGCVWYSSVRNGAPMERGAADLGGEYWCDNMANTVLMHQAVTRAASDSSPFHLTLEIGPHPALKGPVSQTLQELGLDIPYFGTLKRGQSDIKSISECLGELWRHSSPSIVDFDTVSKILCDNTTKKLIKGLPTYTWDHKPYWFESRKVRQYLSRAQRPHSLLGVRGDGDDSEVRYNNFLSAQEVPWLKGHCIQGQIVFPVAGYASMALEASVIAAGNRNVQTIEIAELNVKKAIAFADETSAIETLVVLSKILVEAEGDGLDSCGIITADFTMSSAQCCDNSDLTVAATAKVTIFIGPLAHTPSLSTRAPLPSNLGEVDEVDFYGELNSTGYNYTGAFQGITNIQRRLGFFTCLAEVDSDVNANSDLLIHPALLDMTAQAAIGCHFVPEDGELWSLFLPRSIQKLTVNISYIREIGMVQSIRLPLDAWGMDSSSTRERRADATIFEQNGVDALVQVEGLSFVAIAEPAPGDDRELFHETVWDVLMPDGAVAASAVGRLALDSQLSVELAGVCERLTYYYMRKFHQEISLKDIPDGYIRHRELLIAAGQYLDRMQEQRQPYAQQWQSEWQFDDEVIISALTTRFATANFSIKV